MKKILLIIVLILIPFSHVFSYELKVIDGDTIILNGQKIRFSGIDAPESYYRGKKQICYDGSLEVFCGDLSKKVLIEKIGNNEFYQIQLFENEKPNLILLGRNSYKYEETNDELFYEIFSFKKKFALLAWTTLGYFIYKKFDQKDKIKQFFISEHGIVIDINNL